MNEVTEIFLDAIVSTSLLRMQIEYVFATLKHTISMSFKVNM